MTREAERAVDECDPGKEWDELGEWLEQQIAQSVGDNFVWAHERALWLAEVVAEHFADAGTVELPHLDVGDLDSVLDPVAALSDLESGRIGQEEGCAWVALHDGQLFLQPVEGREPPLCNGAPVSRATWVRDGDTIIMVEIDPNEGSGVIPTDWEAFLQPKGSTDLSAAVRGVEKPDLRRLRALRSRHVSGRYEGLG